MYLLFLQIQGETSAHRLSWLPRSARVTAWWAITLVLLRLLLDLAAAYSISRFTQDLYQELLQRLVHGYHELRWNILYSVTAVSFLNTQRLQRLTRPMLTRCMRRWSPD